MIQMKYELYKKTSEERPMYWFVKQSDQVDDVLGIDEHSLVIRNTPPLLVTRGMAVGGKALDATAYYDLVLECKMAKYCDEIGGHLQNEKILLQRIDEQMLKARRETDMFFAQAKNSKKG